MIMEEIKQSVRYGSESICPSCVHNGVCRAIDNQPCVECDHYRVQDEWISVNDKLPNIGDVVLAFGTRSSTTGQFQGVTTAPSNWWWKGHTIKHVTHWMLLPAPPPGF